MKIVLDTNVLVSGLLTPRGAPAKILNLIIGGKAVILYDDRILDEYTEVLARPRFKFDKSSVDQLLFFFEQEGEWVNPMPLGIDLRDPGDMPFLECAVSGNADVLVTGNLRHFPRATHKLVRVLSPQQFLEYYLQY